MAILLLSLFFRPTCMNCATHAHTHSNETHDDDGDDDDDWPKCIGYCTALDFFDVALWNSVLIANWRTISIIIWIITSKYETNKASERAALFIPCCGTHKHAHTWILCMCKRLIVSGRLCEIWQHCSSSKQHCSQLSKAICSYICLKLLFKLFAQMLT